MQQPKQQNTVPSQQITVHTERKYMQLTLFLSLDQIKPKKKKKYSLENRDSGGDGRAAMEAAVMAAKGGDESTTAQGRKEEHTAQGKRGNLLGVGGREAQWWWRSERR